MVPDAGVRVAAILLAAVLALAGTVGCGGTAHGSTSRTPATGRRAGAPGVAPPQPQSQAQQHPQAPYAVGLRVLHLVDRSRTLRGGGPRTLTTYVRYPALGAADERDHPGAPPALGPFPLVVFGHGYAVTPGIYAALLRSWTRAGFVVAAPVFPLGNAHAPGGPYEPDLVNQPTDMSFVITQTLRLAGLVDPTRIAVAGQSDGGDTALAAAYDPRLRDPRVRAAVILSGAEIPYTGAFTFPAGAPPLLATQGTNDTINPPELTETFFAAARRAGGPSFLLWLTGAEHLPPYTGEQPYLGIVERVTRDFLEHYLGRPRVSLHRMYADASVPGRTRLQSYP